jgi:hypothetical protein
MGHNVNDRHRALGSAVLLALLGATAVATACGIACHLAPAGRHAALAPGHTTVEDLEPGGRPEVGLAHGFSALEVPSVAAVEADRFGLREALPLDSSGEQAKLELLEAVFAYKTTSEDFSRALQLSLVFQVGAAGDLEASAGRLIHAIKPKLPYALDTEDFQRLSEDVQSSFIDAYQAAIAVISHANPAEPMHAQIEAGSIAELHRRNNKTRRLALGWSAADEVLRVRLTTLNANLRERFGPPLDDQAEYVDIEAAPWR